MTAAAVFRLMNGAKSEAGRRNFATPAATSVKRVRADNRGRYEAASAISSTIDDTIT